MGQGKPVAAGSNVRFSSCCRASVGSRQRKRDGRAFVEGSRCVWPRLLQAAIGAGMRCIITYTPSTKNQVGEGGGRREEGK